ncbi:MAG: hypothetical protein ABTD50_12320 [Polyangiaceae bacterium]
MVTELLTRSPLLMAPLVAMFVFLAVFLAIVIRAMAQSQAEIDAAARMPLDVREAQEAAHEHR